MRTVKCTIIYTAMNRQWTTCLTYWGTMTNLNHIFAGIEGSHNEFDKASILLQSIPYDGTSTWGKGADKGFDAFLEASENMEIYDIETDSEVYRQGVHILPPILESSSPKAVYETVYKH